MVDFSIESSKDALTCIFSRVEDLCWSEFPSSCREEFAPTVLEQCHSDW